MVCLVVVVMAAGWGGPTLVGRAARAGFGWVGNLILCVCRLQLHAHVTRQSGVITNFQKELFDFVTLRP